MKNIIKKLRESRGLTQQHLANLSGISLRTIQRLEANNKKPKGHTLTELAKVFDMSPLEFEEQYSSKEEQNETDITSIRFINLSILSFLGIPFGNVIFPMFLWRKYKESKFVSKIAKRIINVQIIFSIILSLLLSRIPY